MAFVAHSQNTENTLWREHCDQVAAEPALFIKKLVQRENRLSFTNHGGMFNGGVCWWHSRLTRAAQYLAVFNPQGTAPTEDEAYMLVKKLRDGHPVTINGFRNLSEFSYTHYKSVQRNLEEWQVSNGGFGFGFLDGLRGSTTVPAGELKQLMDGAYVELTSKQKPVYQVLQLPGVTAHAWLIINMMPYQDGYQFQVVDSNYYDIQTWTYRNGLTNFTYGRQPFVNYTTNKGLKEEKILTQRLSNACKSAQKGQKLAESYLTIDEELEMQEHSPYQP